MHCVRQIADRVFWVGANERRLHLFENLFPIPQGVSYNSYLLLEEQTVLFDTVDRAVGDQFLANVAHVLQGRALDYLIVNHMEPDHCAIIERLVSLYPGLKLVCTAKAAQMLAQFFTFDPAPHLHIVKEGDKLKVGATELTFVMAPMVHWPEVMVTFDSLRGILYAADAFGTFGALGGNIFNDELDIRGEWLGEYRRYYTNIVGKYGVPVRNLLKKAAGLSIKMICPLHGPIWRNDFAYILDKYAHWAAYEPEEQGTLVVYASMYGNLENAANIFAQRLAEAGAPRVTVRDVSSTDVSYLVAESFRYSSLALFAPSYNAGLYPAMQHFLLDLKALGLSNRTVALVEGGSWAMSAGKEMRAILETMKGISIVDSCSIMSSLHENSLGELMRVKDSLFAAIAPADTTAIAK